MTFLTIRVVSFNPCLDSLDTFTTIADEHYEEAANASRAEFGSSLMHTAHLQSFNIPRPSVVMTMVLHGPLPKNSQYQ